jgi:lipid-A-disaccharide synthase
MGPVSDEPLRIFISAGEQSGDGHGAALAKRLQELCPGVILEGVGGPQMAAAGVEVHLDMVEHAAMGIVPVLKKLPFFRAALKDTAARLASKPYDVLVPIDYPGFNLRLSGRARKAGVKVCYYVSPQVWAWRPGRIHRIARLVDHMMVLFPFEKDLYESVGVPCTFVGHPLFDELRMRKPSPAFRAGLGLDPATPLLGILPGSRAQEIERNLPLQLKAAAKVKEADPSVRFALPVAKPKLRPLIEERCAEHPELGVEILAGKASDIARVARAVVTVSGTVTLELLHYECPMVIVYQITPPQEWLAKRLLTTEWISLVNILAGREICPEYLASGDCSDDVARDLLALLRPGKARKRCLTHMKNLLKVVDHKGVHRNAARAVLQVAREARAARAGSA